MISDKILQIRFFAFLLILSFNQFLFAQELGVKSLEQVPDNTASMFEYQHADNNGDYAGIVKVLLPIDDVEFDGGGVLKCKRMARGEYWVWMAKNSSHLMVRAAGFVPFEVNFRNYPDVNIVHSKATYKLVVMILSNVSDGSHKNSFNNESVNAGVSTPTLDNQMKQNSIETFIVNGVSFRMVRVEGGTFQMGATKELRSEAESDEKPVHSVTLSSYMIGETEVTQELWEAVMDSNPSYFKSAKNPVESVSWNDCQAFIIKLNQLTGKQFRLPTEAEWEFAARGGNNCKGYKYAGSNDLHQVGWFWENSGDSLLSRGTHLDVIEDNHCQTHSVGQKFPNELGLYDMSGNVWEWCEDYYYYKYKRGFLMNPKGPENGSSRVYRGGSYWCYGSCRISERQCDAPDERSSTLGLRLAH